MRPTVAWAHRSRPWSGSCWTTSWSCTSSRNQTGHGLLLLHPWHWPLSLNSHLEMIRQGLSAGEHLIRHDLGSELVKLVLVKGSRPTRSSRATTIKARTEAGNAGAKARPRARARSRIPRRSRPVIRPQGMLIYIGAIKRGWSRTRTCRRWWGGGWWHKRTGWGAIWSDRAGVVRATKWRVVAWKAQIERQKETDYSLSLLKEVGQKPKQCVHKSSNQLLTGMVLVFLLEF